MKTSAMTIGSILLRVVAGFALHALILFLGAGTFFWREAWLYLGSYIIAGISIVSWLRKNNADLLRERLTFWKLSAQPQDKAILIIGVPVYIAFLLVPGVDAVRWQYSDVPEVLKALAFGILVISYMISFRALKENAFLTRTIDIQHERGHRVITTGPYKVVRHPFYAAGMISFASVSLTLGSWLGLLPAAGLTLLLVARIHVEEKVLRKGLQGYEEYVQTVRYRLIPGVW